MSLSLRFDRVKQVYHPGDRVSGKVLLDTKEDIDVTRIFVKFEGRTASRAHRASGGDRQVHHGRTTLFEEQQTVFNGNYTLRKQVYEWPFEFIFPTDCRHAKGDQFQDALNYNFDVDPEQGLPPTFLADDDSWNWFCRSSVVYELIATVESSKRKLFKHSTDITYTSPLFLLPPPTTGTPDSNFQLEKRTLFVQSMHLNPEIGSRSLTLKEKMSSAIHHSHLPTATFDLSVQFPTYDLPGSSLPITISISHDLQRSTHGGEPPMVYLKRYELNLESTTKIRCIPATISLESSDPSPKWTQTLTSYTSPEKDLHVPIPEALDLRTHSSNRLLLPWHITPTFRTFNISRTYSLKLKLVLECAQHKLHVEFEGLKLRVRPANENVATEVGLWSVIGANEARTEGEYGIKRAGLRNTLSGSQEQEGRAMMDGDGDVLGDDDVQLPPYEPFVSRSK
ncbi:MAG: hypothetical protein MMC33_003895 [Icmadophila ericetorum]|nr:hypothetical protein [Icmadophila ericetorum]